MSNSVCVQSIEGITQRRSGLKTSDGYIRLSPDTVQAGDCVVILPGVGVPYVARPVGADVYTFLDEGYVPGVLHGVLSTSNHRLRQNGWNFVEFSSICSV